MCTDSRVGTGSLSVVARTQDDVGSVYFAATVARLWQPPHFVFYLAEIVGVRVVIIIIIICLMLIIIP